MKILNRARALYGGKEYIISQSVKFEHGNMFLYSKPFKQWVECDESTRSIHISDMTDSEGTKIFASLSEDGKGGDEINLKTVFAQGEIKTAIYLEMAMWLKNKVGKEFLILDMLKYIKVTGIQQ